MDSTKFWGRWDPAHRDVGVCDPRNMLLPPELPCEIRSLSVKPYERNYGDLPENFDPSRPAFKVTQVKIIGTDTDRSATYDFLFISVPQ